MKPSLTSGSGRPDTHGSYVTFMPVSTKMSMISCKEQHLFLVCYVMESQNIFACADGIFQQERKTQYLQTWRWSVVPNESSRDFGPCEHFWTPLGLSLLFATDLASRYGIEGEICRPLNHMWQIPRLLTAPNRPCQFNARIRWLKYTKEKSFYLSCGKHWRPHITKCAHAPY